MTKTVLIVDDHRGIRFLLEEIIRSEGYRAISCENGMEAIDTVLGNRPDLMIIDFQLPIKNGAEIIMELEERGYFIPIIMMSGLIENVKSETKDFKSVKAYFSKPFDIIEAKAQINQLLANKKQVNGK